MSHISIATEVRNEPRVNPARKLDISRLGFGPFIFVNVMLLVRPGELFPALLSFHLYELSMLVCLLIYWPRIAVALRLERLRQTPITVCVIGLLPLLALSLMWQSRLDMFAGYVVEYLKIALYYMLLVSAVDTPERLRRFVLTLALIITVVGVVALGHHLDIWTVPSIKTLIDKRSATAEGMLFVIQTVKMERMLGVGIFADPNDLAQILGVGMVLAVYGFELSRWAVTKALWLGPILVMAAGIYYTKSRGGLLAMLAGLGILFMARFGLKKAIILGALTIPPMLLAFGSYQTTISTEDDSAQSRVQLWSDSLQALRDNPLFGIGPGLMNEYSGQVSHNSFLQAFAETGLPGGFLFLSAYAIAIFGVLRIAPVGGHHPEPGHGKADPSAGRCHCLLRRRHDVPDAQLRHSDLPHPWSRNGLPADSRDRDGKSVNPLHAGSAWQVLCSDCLFPDCYAGVRQGFCALGLGLSKDAKGWPVVLPAMWCGTGWACWSRCSRVSSSRRTWCCTWATAPMGCGS